MALGLSVAAWVLGPTLAAVACFADGPTTIRNVANVRVKESDRIAVMATELRRLGVKVDEFADGLTIHPSPMTGATVQTYDDHRIAMSLALVGLKVSGVIVSEPDCVRKTYPDFWQDLEGLTGERASETSIPRPNGATESSPG